MDLFWHSAIKDQSLPEAGDHAVHLTSRQCWAQGLSHSSPSINTCYMAEWTSQLIDKSRLLAHMLRFWISAFSGLFGMAHLSPHTGFLFVLSWHFLQVTHPDLDAGSSWLMQRRASLTSANLGVVSCQGLGDFPKVESHLGAPLSYAPPDQASGLGFLAP